MSNENNVIEMPNLNTDETQLSIFEDRSKDFLTNVKKANLLTPALTEKITALAGEMAENFRNSTIWRTSCEIRFSVLNDMNFPD